MEKKLSYSDVCQALDNFLEGGTKETLLKSLSRRKRLETLEGRRRRLSSLIELFIGSIEEREDLIRYIACPEEAPQTKTYLRRLRETKIDEEEREEIKKVYTLVKRVNDGLNDVFSIIDSLSEKEISETERLIKYSLPTLTETIVLAMLCTDEIIEENEVLLPTLRERRKK